MSGSTKNVLITPSNNDNRYFQRIFEGVWFDVKVAKDRIKDLEYVAIYRSEQSSSELSTGVITHMGKIRKDDYGVVPYGTTGGYLFNFDEVVEVGPLWRTPETKYGFQQFTYCTLEEIQNSSDLHELEQSWVK